MTPIGIIILTVIVLTWVIILIIKSTGEMSQWPTLVKSFSSQTRGKPPVCTSLYINDTQYNLIIRIHIDSDGLYLAPMWPFSYRMKPLLIPFDRLQITSTHRFWLRKINIDADSLMSLHLPESYISQIESFLLVKPDNAENPSRS